MNHIQIAQAYRRHLPAGVLHAFRIDALDRLGVPVVTVRLLQDDGTTFEGIGYGATAEEAMVGALGELSEEAHCDRALRDMPRVVGSYAELVRQRGERAVADPLTLCLPAGSRYTPEQPLVWVAATRVATRETVWVPEEFAADSRSQLRSRDPVPKTPSLQSLATPHVPSKMTPLVTPITNGLGAGTSFAQALVHGLLELLQRDGNVLSYRALDRGIVIDIDEAALHDAALAALLARYRDAGVDILAKVAATDFGMLNVVVVGAEAPPEIALSNTALSETLQAQTVLARTALAQTALAQTALPLRLTACGEAVHPDRERALRKALLEFAGSRCRKMFRHGPLARIAGVVPDDYLARVVGSIDLAAEEPRALHAMVEWLGASDAVLRERLAPVLAVSARVGLQTLPTVASGMADDPHQRLALVAGRLADAGLDVLAVDFSPPGGEIVALKAIVPGLEMETMSYHRIGERGLRRLLDRQSEWVRIGNGRVGNGPIVNGQDGLRRVPLTAAAEARLGGPAWLDVEAIDRAVGALYPLYREPSGHAAQLQMQAQLQAQLQAKVQAQLQAQVQVQPQLQPQSPAR